MSNAFLYAAVGVGLFCLSLYALIVHTHLLRKILAINVIGSGVFLVMVALAALAALAGGRDALGEAMRYHWPRYWCRSPTCWVSCCPFMRWVAWILRRWPCGRSRLRQSGLR